MSKTNNIINRWNEMLKEEKIEQMEKHIKNQAMYDEIRKAGDDLALAIEAIQDSGFSREEAMQIFMIAMINNTIPPFLRR